MTRSRCHRSGPAAVTGIGLAALAVAAPATAEMPVALELVLAIDGSSGIDPFEHVLPRVGLSAAFRDPGVVQAVESVAGDVGTRG